VLLKSENFVCVSAWVRNLVPNIKEYRLRVLENRVLRRIIGSKRDEMIGAWGENCIMRSFITYSYCSSYTIRIIMANTMKWAGHVTRMWKRETLACSLAFRSSGSAVSRKGGA
jgi:hypothetical protein